MNDAVFDRQTLSGVWQEHVYTEFVLKDADKKRRKLERVVEVASEVWGTAA